MSLSLAIYNYSVSDAINQLSTGNPAYIFEVKAVNLGTRNGDGAEFELRYLASESLYFGFNYSYADTVFSITDGERPVPGVPKQSANVWVTAKFFDGELVWNTHAFMRAKWVTQPGITFSFGPGFDVPFVGDNELPDYTLLNTHLEWRGLSDKTVVTFSVRNMLDEHPTFADQVVYAPAGIPTNRRQYLLGMRYDF